MKRVLLFLIAVVVVVVCSYSLVGTRNDTSLEINRAICLGQSEHIADYLAPEVSLVIQGTATTCPKGQVEQVLCEFFRRNKPSQFLCTTGMGLMSGNLVTSSGRSYKVEYMLKNIDNKEVITGFYVY
ncbi:MAG: DUF4783 domain-containing protein [Bacteroidales bacterium]|nr:DUF4783 domain-containing protein [Bacteroidales bacterium]